MIQPVKADAAAIAEAARILRAGGLVAFPTETVYGLGADATNDGAVAKIFAAKGRPSFNPLIVHVGGIDWVRDLAETDSRFDALTRVFWPGPLTFVLKRLPACPVSRLVSAGMDSIALRWPDHALAQRLLNAAGRPLAAPSANPSGAVSPTRAVHVAAAMGDKVDMILDGGPCRIGLESTVLDLTSRTAKVLRPGAVTAEDIAKTIGGPVEADGGDPLAPKSPGQLLSHYAPRLPLRLNAETAEPGEALLGFGPAPQAAANLSPSGSLTEAAANLFALLRALDDPGRFSGIAVMPVPRQGLGAAINDRLTRAARR